VHETELVSGVTPRRLLPDDQQARFSSVVSLSLRATSGGG
jgi:hypothetical protein